jgi:hypothetical protein
MVDELAALELKPPQVTEFARMLDPLARELPVTVGAAVAWFGARA